MEFDFEVRALSNEFYRDYPLEQYPELMRKDKRPYTCLLVDTHEDYLICIPFRSRITHNEAFIFSGTKRSERTRSGLDYRKVVPVKNLEYIAPAPVVIDKDEYEKVVRHINKVIKDIVEYIDRYICHATGEHVLHKKEYLRHYQYSTLPYFHDILGI